MTNLNPSTDVSRTPPVREAPAGLKVILSLATRFVVSLWALITLTFMMLQLVPGDPVRASLGMSASPQEVAAARANLNLDQPLLKQYFDYLGNVVTGDFGDSIIRRIPVTQIVAAGLWNTVILTLAAFALALVIAIPLGSIGAAIAETGLKRRQDFAFTAVTTLGASVPEFLLGVGLVFVFAVSWPVLPVAGSDGPVSFVLPVLALSMAPAFSLARILRTEGTRVLREEYIRTARAKRLTGWRVHTRHVLPNVVPTGLTVGALLLGGMLAATVLVESVFSWPGLGEAFVQAIQDKDYPVVQTIALIYGAMVLLLNLAVDVAIVVIDPRADRSAL